MADYINREVTLKILTRIADCVSDSRRRAVTRCIREIALLPPANVEPVCMGGGKSATGLTWTSMGSVQEEPLRQDCGVASALVFSKRSCFGNETIAPAAAQK